MVSLNNCRRCSYKNISLAMDYATGCQTVQKPTEDSSSGPLSCHVISFGQLADHSPRQRLHASKFDEAIHVFLDRTPVAVRVGWEENIAIIRYSNGDIRSSTHVTRSILSRCPPRTWHDLTDFVNFARVILLTDPDQDRGTKTSFTLNNATC
jgi:hypothetical protein